MRNAIRALVGIPPDQPADDTRLIAELTAWLAANPMVDFMLKDIVYNHRTYDYDATGTEVIDIIREKLKSSP